MMYKTMRYGSLRGLRGAFDLNATVVPAGNQLVAQVPASKPITASATAYAKIAPLIKPPPAPLTILKSGTITTLDEAEADPPSGSNMVGPDRPNTVPGVVFGSFDTPAIADSTGTSTASDDVAEAHEASLDPSVSDDLPRAEDFGVTRYEGPPSTGSGIQRPRAASRGWLWALGAAAVVGGIGFLIFRRR